VSFCQPEHNPLILSGSINPRISRKERRPAANRLTLINYQSFLLGYIAVIAIRQEQ
jgi:hypothetical protein